MKTVAFFNNKDGVGKTMLVYHLAWMFQELGVDTVALDLDPQASLTTAFLPDEVLEQLWLNDNSPQTILGVLQPLLDKLGDIKDPIPREIGERLALLPGHLGLSRFEDEFAEAWPRCLEEKGSEAFDAFRVMTAFYRVAERAALARRAELVLIDVSSSLGALNRAALLASDYVILVLGADLYSLQGLRNLGPALEKWRVGWKKRIQGNAPPDLTPPSGDMKPVGYVLQQHRIFAGRPIKADQHWIERIPAVYHHEILGEPKGAPLPHPDTYQLAALRPYRSLMLLAQEARKPMFLLRPAEGAIGGHSEAVLDYYRDFKALAIKIAAVCGIAIPSSSAL